MVVYRIRRPVPEEPTYPTCTCVQALVFARFSEHENLYAHPMDFVPVIDANADEVIHIGM
ncbi:hypothetical protein BDZ89DRAFT_1213902, partial [Hymenopellis radicata]